MIKEDDLQEIGRFAKPHGVKGEIVLVTDYEIADIPGDPFIVCDIDGIWTPFFIASYRQKNFSSVLVTFDYLDSADKVALLTGKTAFFSPFEGGQGDVKEGGQGNQVTNNKPKETSPYPSSAPLTDHLQRGNECVIGYTLIDPHIGVLGQVTHIDNRTLNILLSVNYKDTEILIPLALATSIQHDKKTITLSLPEGFLEIYQNETKK